MDFASLIALSVGAIVVITVVALAIFIFEVMMFIDVILNKGISDEARILWVIGMLILHPFVAIAYFFTDRNKRDRPPAA